MLEDVSDASKLCLRPVAYTLCVSPEFSPIGEPPCRIPSESTARFVCETPTGTLLLHAQDLDIQDVRIAILSAGCARRCGCCGSEGTPADRSTETPEAARLRQPSGAPPCCGSQTDAPRSGATGTTPGTPDGGPSPGGSNPTPTQMGRNLPCGSAPPPGSSGGANPGAACGPPNAAPSPHTPACCSGAELPPDDVLSWGNVAPSDMQQCGAVLCISLPREVSCGEQVLLRTAFTASSPEDGSGGYFSPQRGGGGTGSATPSYGTLATHLEPLRARTVLPCVDLPAAKAFFSLTVRRTGIPNGMSILSNTPVSSESPESVEFEMTPRMSPYLFCLIVGDFHSLQADGYPSPIQHGATPPIRRNSAEGRSGAPPVRLGVHIPKSEGLESARVALEVLRLAIVFYEHVFQQPVGLRKIDLVGLPGLRPVAMENVGCIAFRLQYLTVGPSTPLSRVQRIVRLVGHESCHQWFGNLVSLTSWSHLWVKEGNARFLEYLFVGWLFPGWDFWGEFAASILKRSMPDQGVATVDRPIESCCAETGLVVNSFDTVTYSKGAGLVSMVSSSLGLGRSLSGMQAFLLRHAGSHAGSLEYAEAMRDAASADSKTPPQPLLPSLAALGVAPGGRSPGAAAPAEELDPPRTAFPPAESPLGGVASGKGWDAAAFLEPWRAHVGHPAVLICRGSGGSGSCTIHLHQFLSPAAAAGRLRSGGGGGGGGGGGIALEGSPFPVPLALSILPLPSKNAGGVDVLTATGGCCAAESSRSACIILPPTTTAAGGAGVGEGVAFDPMDGVVGGCAVVVGSAAASAYCRVWYAPDVLGGVLRVYPALRCVARVGLVTDAFALHRVAALLVPGGMEGPPAWWPAAGLDAQFFSVMRAFAEARESHNEVVQVAATALAEVLHEAQGSAEEAVVQRAVRGYLGHLLPAVQAAARAPRWRADGNLQEFREYRAASQLMPETAARVLCLLGEAGCTASVGVARTLKQQLLSGLQCGDGSAGRPDLLVGAAAIRVCVIAGGDSDWADAWALCEWAASADPDPDAAAPGSPASPTPPSGPSPALRFLRCPVPDLRIHPTQAVPWGCSLRAHLLESLALSRQGHIVAGVAELVGSDEALSSHASAISYCKGVLCNAGLLPHAMQVLSPKLVWYLAMLSLKFNYGSPAWLQEYPSAWQDLDESMHGAVASRILTASAMAAAARGLVDG